MLLSKNEILSANDTVPKIAPVEVPEWGGEVLVKVMSGRDRERFEQAVTKGEGNLRAKLAALTLCDEQGKSYFSEAEATQLGEKSSAALHRVYLAAMRINALAKGDVEELEKNSESAT